jgi:ribonuclease P protein component
MKRLLREAVRLHLAELPAGWLVVFNPRRAILNASKEVIEREVTRVFSQCKNS